MKTISKIILASFFGLMPMLLNGQACGNNFIPNFKKGNTDLSLGIGFGSHVFRPETYTTVPFFNVNVDHALRDDLGPGILGVGGFMGFERYRREYSPGDYGFNYSSLTLEARGTYHYQFIEDFDTYAGIGLGFRIINSGEFGTHPVNGPVARDGLRIGASLFVGGRYFFNDNTAAFAELGLVGAPILNLGVTFRLQ